MCRRRPAAEHRRRGQLARHALDQPRAHRRRQRGKTSAQLRPREPLEDVLLVRIAAEDAREVERQRNAEHGDARREQSLDVDRKLPAVRARGFEQRRRAACAHRLGRCAAQERRGPACDHRLGCGNRHDEIGLDQRARDAQRHVAGRSELDQVLGLGVVDDHLSAEAPPEVGAEEQADLARRQPLVEPGGDGDRHASRRVA